VNMARLLLLFPPAPVVAPTVTCNKRKIWLGFFSSSLLHRWWHPPSPATREKHKQLFLFYFSTFQIWFFRVCFSLFFFLFLVADNIEVRVEVVVLGQSQLQRGRGSWLVRSLMRTALLWLTVKGIGGGGIGEDGGG